MLPCIQFTFLYISSCFRISLRHSSYLSACISYFFSKVALVEMGERASFLILYCST
jgi:hypothetical protein